jgi:hypothetical protein
MLFRNTEGELIEIRKSSYKNDLLYYRAIMNTITPTQTQTQTTSSSVSNKKDVCNFQMDEIISKIKNISGVNK